MKNVEKTTQPDIILSYNDWNIYIKQQLALKHSQANQVQDQPRP